jgi:hypothetical protein
LDAAGNEGRHSVSGNFAIAPVTSVQAAQPSRGVTVPAPAASAPSLTGASGPPPVNPGLHLDPALNIVVLQFYDSKGDVTQSIPSQKQLQAYQQDSGQPPTASAWQDTYQASNLTAPS